MTTVTLQDVVREELRMIDKSDDPQVAYNDLMALAEQLTAQLRVAIETMERLDMQGYREAVVGTMAYHAKEIHLLEKDYLRESGLASW